MKVQTKDLNDIVNRMMKLSGSNESNTLRIQANDGKLEIIGVALTGRLKQTTVCDGDFPVVYLDKDVLSRVLATRSEKEPIEFSIKEKTVTISQASFKANVIALTGTYKFDDETYPLTWSADSEWLKRVMEVCSIPVDKDPVKTRGVLLDLRTNRPCAVGADSIGPGQIHVVESPGVSQTPGTVFALSRQSAQFIAMLEVGTFQFENTGRRLLAHGKDSLYRASAIRNSYPDNYRTLFRLDEFHSWSILDFNRVQLLLVLAAAQSVMSDKDQTYRFTIKDKYFDDDTKSEKLVVEISGKNERVRHEAIDKILVSGHIPGPIKFALRRGKLESSLRAMVTDTVRFHVKDRDTHVVLTEEPDKGFRAIHLPLR